MGSTEPQIYDETVVYKQFKMSVIYFLYALVSYCNLKNILSMTFANETKN